MVKSTSLAIKTGALKLPIEELGALRKFAVDSKLTGALRTFLDGKVARARMLRREGNESLGFEPSTAQLADKYIELAKVCRTGIGRVQLTDELSKAIGFFAVAEVMYLSEHQLEKLDSKAIHNLAESFSRALRVIDRKLLGQVIRSYENIRSSGCSLTLDAILDCCTVGFKSATGLLDFMETIRHLGKMLADPQRLGGSLRDIARAMLPMCNTKVKLYGRVESALEAVDRALNDFSRMTAVTPLLSPEDIVARDMTALKAAKLVAAFASCPTFLSTTLISDTPYKHLSDYVRFVKTKHGAALVEKWRTLGLRHFGLFKNVYRCSKGLSSEAIDRLIAAAGIITSFESLYRSQVPALKAILKVLPACPVESQDVQEFVGTMFHRNGCIVVDNTLSFQDAVALVQDITRRRGLLPILTVEAPLDSV